MDPPVAPNPITPLQLLPPLFTDYTFTFRMMTINGKDSSHRETHLHPVVRQSAPHPGNNLVANWLEDGENWKLKLEILIINREEGGKKGQEMRCGAAMRLARLANEVFCLSWNVCDMTSQCCRDIKARKREKKKKGEKRLPSNLRLQKILWCSWKFVLCPCGVVFFPLLCHFPWQSNMSRSWYVGLQ